MTTIAEHLGRQEQIDAVDMAIRVGCPKDPSAPVICVDCGKQTMAVACYWHINRHTLDHTGPHCGCTERTP